MPNMSRFRSLGVKEKALVAVAVLLDGRDAVTYLGSDKEMSAALTRAASDLAELAPELRMPLVGTILRNILKDLGD